MATGRTILLTDLRKTREGGYFINNEESVLELISIGAPLINKNGEVFGAVSFDVPTVQFTLKEADKSFVPAALRRVQDIQPMLPYRERQRPISA